MAYTYVVIEMSETREPEYVVLDWNEDFKLDAHVDSTGQQRFGLIGYIQKRRADGVYQAPIIPELFYGVDGTQLSTWSQNLTAGDHTILRRDSGNPFVPDSELAWRKISDERRTAPATPTRVVTSALDTNTIMLVVVGLGAVGLLYYLIKR